MLTCLLFLCVVQGAISGRCWRYADLVRILLRTCPGSVVDGAELAWFRMDGGQCECSSPVYIHGHHTLRHAFVSLA